MMRKHLAHVILYSHLKYISEPILIFPILRYIWFSLFYNKSKAKKIKSKKTRSNNAKTNIAIALAKLTI